MKIKVLVFLCFLIPFLGSSKGIANYSVLHEAILADSSVIINNFQKLLPSVNKKEKLSGKVLPVEFGVRVGLNYSNMNFNKGYSSQAIPTESSWKPGFNVGMLLKIRLSKKFYIQQEYVYSLRRGNINSLNTEYIHHYLSLPAILKYNVTSKFIIVAGPQFDLLLKATEGISNKDNDNTNGTESRNIGATAGLEYKFSDFCSLNARFMHGLNHIGVIQLSGTKEFKYELVQLSVIFIL